LNAIAPTLEGPLAALRESEIRLLTDIATMLAELGENAADDRQRLLDVAQDLREMFFLVVVIGEFNAGKSSFVNALLGDDLLPMGITPTTEMIEVIRYGDSISRKPETRGDSIREWTHPNTGAQGVAIVDTPGTGSVFLKHETTAKAFLHRADLVIFVLSAKRAMAEAERMYLEMAKNYGKKIIMVINQVDLLAPQEQADVRRFVERQLEELLGLKPLVFMVSAKEARQASPPDDNLFADGSAAGDPGGIKAIRAHLRGVFSEAPPAKQKLLSQLDSAANAVNRANAAIKGRADLVSADTSKVRDVKRELEQQATGLSGQLATARAEIDRVFEGLRRRAMDFITENLSLRKLGRLPSREALQAQFQDVVIGRALREIDDASGQYINALIDNSRQYWRGIIDRLNKLQETLEQEMSGLDAGVYAEQREALQEAIRIADAELKTYSSGKVIADIQAEFSNNANAFVTSTGAAIVGLIIAVIAIATPGPLVGAGAAALALPAFVIAAPLTLLGGVVAVRYYQRITSDAKRDMNERIDGLQKAYHEALDNLTQRERGRLTQYGTQVLTPIFSRLEVLANRYSGQQTALRNFEMQIATLRKGIEEVK
jgi:small GTP-binding protein